MDINSQVDINNIKPHNFNKTITRRFGYTTSYIFNRLCVFFQKVD